MAIELGKRLEQISEVEGVALHVTVFPTLTGVMVVGLTPSFPCVRAPFRLVLIRKPVLHIRSHRGS